MAYNKDWVINFRTKYQAPIIALVLSIFTLPGGFYYFVDNGVTGSWVRALNFAVKDHLQFGSDFVFTYGPLGYLSTRDTQYVHDIYLLLADIFLCSCFYYVFRKYLSRYKGWGLMLLAAVFFYKNPDNNIKGIEFAGTLFFFLIVYAILSFQNGFRNNFEVIVTAVCGVVVFFVKVNYGLIALPVMLSLLVFQFINNKKAALLFLITALFAFGIIYFNTNVVLVKYIKYGIPMIMDYNEAMLIPFDPFGRAYVSAVTLCVVFTAIMVWYFLEGKKYAVKVYPVMLLSLLFFLMYKNAFTRADAYHIYPFFQMFPLFLILVIFLCSYGDSKIAKTMCVLSIVLCFLNIKTPVPNGVSTKRFIYNETIAPTINYCATLFKKQPDIMDPHDLAMPGDKIKLIGRSTIDIFPIDITALLTNGLNYDPRPVVQSYSVYSPVLDSLNADHFYKDDRPEYAMFWNISVGDRYAAWDESITRAMLHLNYEYYDFVSLTNDTALNDNYWNYVLLRSKKGIKKYPVFEQLYEQTINMGDTVHINFPGDTPVYMTADIEYNTTGKIENFFYQYPVISVSLFFDTACDSSVTQGIVRPVLQGPVLISRAVLGNKDLKNFITGDLEKNAEIKAFAFHATGNSCKQKIKITFLKFSNY